jgi:hypothetical protein
MKYYEEVEGQQTPECEMAKRKTNAKTVEQVMAQQKPAQEPKLTHAGFQIAFWAAAVGLVAQLAIAFMVYPTLPKMIPSWWVGQLVQQPMIPSWTVFAVFPVGQIVLLLIALFSPRNQDGKRIMESGKVWTLTTLAVLFTVLQASAFHLPKG